MTYVISNACVDIMDKSCVRECPVDCIYEGARSMYINADECIDCGACEPACPVDAIYNEDDLTPGQVPLVERAAEFLAGVGAAGGAKRFGPIGTDHPEVAALPTRTVP